MAAKKLFIPLIVLVFVTPLIASAASATYTSSTATLEVPDSFSIADLDVTLNLDADINALEVSLISPAGTRIGLYTRHRAFGTKFRKTTFDDEATTSLVGSHPSWSGRFLPNQALSSLDGTDAQGTWTLDLSYPDGTTPALPIVLHSWILTFQGAEPSTIAGTKYHDKNGNGIRDSGEAGLSGWTLFLDLNNDTELDSGEPTATTDGDGHYQFTDLDINDYVIRELFQPQWFQTAPRGNRLPVRTLSGRTTENADFGNIPEAETTASQNTNTTTVPIQDDGEAVRARSTITVPDSFLVVDTNVTIDANALLFDTRFNLIGPDGTRVVLFREGSTGIIEGDRFRGTTFDDQAPQTIGDGDRPPFINSYRPKEFLTAQNQNSAGDWTLEALDTNPGNGTSGEILTWTLELRTPLDTQPEPIVLVPGLAASFNPAVTILDRSSNQWNFAPGIRPIYQALLDRFAQEGLLENRDFFIAHYDWRKPAGNSVTNYLKPVIDQAKLTTGSDKVDIVTHSMGGLVARSYIQGANYDNDIDQLVTLGTPHLGAADAYAAWEGGILPERWGKGTRLGFTLIERAVTLRSLDPAKPRPLSLREFFPSLKDLLPVNDFVIRNNSPFAIGQHAEQNPFLQQLRTDFDLIKQRGVKVTTIGGNSVPTLNQVFLKGERTNEDISRQRWRDGHPNPDPPATDTTLGDQTVLLSSALFGNNSITLNNAPHDKLPEEAQEEVLEALGLDSAGPHIAYDLPDSLMGTVVLSPVTPSFTFPNGTVFTCDATKQEGSVECVLDETDPNGPKLLVVADPPTGDYKITLTGTGSGPYHAITCFADEDQDGCTTREGSTTAGKVETYKVQVGAEDFKAPPEDIFTLTDKLRRAIPRLTTEKHIKPEATNPLSGPASYMYAHASAYKSYAASFGFDHPYTQQYFNQLKQEFGKFKTALDQQINLGRLDTTAILELTSLRDQLTDAGL